MKFPLTILLLAFSHLALQAQYASLGAGAFGMANATVAVPNLSSIYLNPAGMSMQKQSFVAVAFHKTLLIEGLNTLGAWGTFKSKIVDLGFSADNFGDEIYHETRLGLAASKKMDKVAMGLKFSLQNNSIKEMSSRQTILGEFGILATPSKFFSVGLHVINFTRASLYESQALPTFVNFGFALNPSKKVGINGQFDYPVGEKPLFKMGMSYQMKEYLALSTGVNPALNAIHFGLSFEVNKYQFAYSVSTHPNVGLSNHLTLAFLLNEKK